MTIREVNELADIMAALYGERFAGFTPAMAQFWQEDLAHLEILLVRAALRRWVRFHTDRAPSLDQLLEQVELVREEQSRTIRQGSSTASYPDILRQAAEAQASNPLTTEAQARYGHLMATLGERSCGPWQDEHGAWHEKLTLDQCAAQCYAWANTYEATHPKLAEDLRYTMRVYTTMLVAETS